MEEPNKIVELVSSLYVDADNDPIILSPSQVEIFSRIMLKDKPRVHVMTSTQFGKLTDDNTIVKTISKGIVCWKRHGDLVVGDKVFNELGCPVDVLHIHPEGVANLEVEFSNGEKIRCHENHEWIVKNTNWKRRGKGFEKMETKKIMEYKTRMVVPNIKPLEYKDTLFSDELDPYSLGVWLGDGTSAKPAITSPVCDKEIIDKFAYKPTNINVHKDTGVPTYYFYKTTLLPKLRELNLIENKHIPYIYKFASIKDRLELLAGLIDSDGYVAEQVRKDTGDKDGRVYITNCNKRLVDDIVEVIISLGMRPSVVEQQPCMSSSGIQGRQVVYIIGFDPFMEIPTVLPRKKVIPKTKQRHISIKSIKKIKPVSGRCITVNGGVYLVGETLIPTHNSLVVALAVLTRVCTFPEKWVIVAPSANKAMIIMQYIIEHAFDNEFTKSKLRLDPEESLDRIRRERSKNRLTFTVAGKISEVFILSADSKNKKEAGNALMGFGCIMAGNKIMTDSGDIDIDEVVNKELKVNILSYNHKFKCYEYKNIISYQKNPRAGRDMYEIEMEDGVKFQCTNDHPVCISDFGPGEYVRADEVEVGDTCTAIGTSKRRIIKNVRKIPAKPTWVYNLEVADNHNYFINGLLLHNSPNIILDEAALIDDDINAKILRMLGGHSMKKTFFMKIGNPFRRNHFLKSFNSDRYHKIIVTWEQAVAEGRFSADFIAEMKEEPVFDVLYECKFPTGNEVDEKGWAFLLNDDDIENALVDTEVALGMNRLGCDVADSGRDSSCIVYRNDIYAQIVFENFSINTMSFGGHIVNEMRDRDVPPEYVSVDKTGVGVGLCQRLRELGHKIYQFIAAEKAVKHDQFRNKRAEVAWEVRKWIRAGGKLIKDDRWNELKTIKYRIDESSGKIQIMSKDLMSTYGYKSPNVFDAFALTFVRKNVYNEVEAQNHKFEKMLRRKKKSNSKANSQSYNLKVSGY